MMEKTMERTKSKFGWIISLLILLGLAGFAKADMVGLWQFEEGSGTVVSDSTDYNNDGAIGETTTPDWITRPGGGNALALGQSNGQGGRNWSFVSVPRSAVLQNLGSQWTIALWVRHDINNPTIIGQGGGGGSGYSRVVSCPNYEIELGVPTDGNDYFWPYNANPLYGNPGSWQRAIGASYFNRPGGSLGTWYHLALTYDGTSFIKYINGVPVYTATDIVDQLLPNSWAGYGDPVPPLRFGAQCDPTKDRLIGALDDVAIFDEALDATEIIEIKDGDFSGPWQKPETSAVPGFASYLYNPTFIYEYSQQKLELEEHWRNHGPWNWEVTGIKDNTDYFGVANVSAWDGGNTDITKYAAFITLGDNVVQRAEWGTIAGNTRYNLSARFAGSDGGDIGTSAVGNVVGVRFYRQSNPDDPNSKVLISDLHQTITTEKTWLNPSVEYVSDPAHAGQYFRAECYIAQGTGGARGQAFGYFDEVIIAMVEPLDCAAAIQLGFKPALDLNDDCFVNLDEFSQLSSEWQSNNSVEPIQYAGELFTNWSFFGDAVSVPNVGDYVGQGVPTGWTITNSSGNVYGYQNLATTGQVNSVENGDWEAAGGTVAVYLDPNATLSQTVTSETIQNGQTYYLSAMVSGDFTAYANNFPAGNLIEVIFEAVNNPTTPTVIENIATLQFASPQERVWRRLTHVHTGIAATAGKYLRVRAKHVPVEDLTFNFDPFIWIGNVSATKTRPSDWTGTNLLTNGNFEDVSNYDQAVQINLLGSRNGYEIHTSAADAPKGWTYDPIIIPGVDTQNGLQSMLWAPSPQPSQGRVCIFLNVGSVITQRVESTPIASTTYHLASVSTTTASKYNDLVWTWPVDPTMTVDVYWYDPATPPTINGPIASLVATADNSLGISGGHWQVARSSFTPPPQAIGKRFYVKAYGSNQYAHFDDIYLSTTAWPVIPPYTCAQFISEGGTTAQTDFNQDCAVDIDDFTALAEAWLDCTDPAVTGCEHGWLP